MKKISYLDKVQNKNVFEEYCVVLPRFLGRPIKYYDLRSERRAVLSENKSDKTIKKIVILLSHFTLVIPLIMYTGKALQRAVHPIYIAVQIPDDFQEHEKNDYEEIRKLREDSSYIPEECKGHRFPLRLQLPIDRILGAPVEQKLDGQSFFNQIQARQDSSDINDKFEDSTEDQAPDIAENPFFNFLGIFSHTPLNPEIERMRQQILKNNGFSCVHGVESAKGGRRNVLNMMLEGVVRAPYTGGLMEGPSDCCAGPHGPYYVILDPGYCKKSAKRHGLWEESAQVAFLVPNEEDREYFEDGLSKAVEKQFIDEEEKQRMLRKVITYKEFLALPKSIRHSERKLANWLKNNSTI